MGILRYISSLIRLVQNQGSRPLTFYSEGRNYWPHLKGLVFEILESADIPVTYISSNSDDPGLVLTHPRFETFLIDEGAARNWLFRNIKTDVMVMTMPDIEHFQVKRSIHDVHYVYVQHSLCSLHMIYRKGAFDHYDTIFCAGPHHVREVRAMEKSYGTQRKTIVEHGYGRLDEIRAEAKRRGRSARPTNGPLHVLLAPSWGPYGAIESGRAGEIVSQLLDQGHRVTLRPHPQTTKFARDKVDAIVDRERGNPRFAFEANVDGQDSLHTSDVMVSDWSGAALDYAFGLNKPILFVDTPRKVNNRDYQQIGLEPVEAELRNKIGAVWEDGIDVGGFADSFVGNEAIVNDYTFNLGKSASCGAQYLTEICNRSRP